METQRWEESEKRREGKGREEEEKRKGREEKGKGREEKRREEERREEERRSEKRKSQKKEDAGAWKGRKVAIHYVSSMICGPGGSKSRLAKAAGAGPSGQVRDEKCTPLWREAHFQVKMHNAHKVQTTFGHWDVGKVHSVVARSTFGSQNVQSTPSSDHFWKMRCRKSARFWREARFQVKSIKHTRFGALFEVEMSKKCMPLCREAMRSTFPSQKCQKLTGTEHFWTFRCNFVWEVEGIVHLVNREQNVRVL